MAARTAKSKKQKGLGKVRKEEPRAATMLLKCRTELAGQKPLLALRFPGEGGQNEYKTYQRPVPADSQRRPHNGEQHAGVNRVANPGVRPGANQLMIGPQRHGGAPILGDVITRPDGKGHTGKSERRSGDKYPVALGNKSALEDAEAPIVAVKEYESRGHHHDSADEFDRRFRPGHAVDAQARQNPVRQENQPRQSDAIRQIMIHGDSLPSFYIRAARPENFARRSWNSISVGARVLPLAAEVLQRK